MSCTGFLVTFSTCSVLVCAHVVHLRLDLTPEQMQASQTTELLVRCAQENKINLTVAHELNCNYKVWRLRKNPNEVLYVTPPPFCCKIQYELC